MAKDANHDMMTGNSYSPSERANKATRIATSRSGYKPDGSDMNNVKPPKGADQPSDQHTGGKPRRNTQSNEASMTEPSAQGRGPIERGNI